jgi:hypothetical protein
VAVVAAIITIVTTLMPVVIMALMPVVVAVMSVPVATMIFMRIALPHDGAPFNDHRSHIFVDDTRLAINNRWRIAAATTDSDCPVDVVPRHCG